MTTIEKKDKALYKLTEMTVDDFNKVTSMTVDEFQNQLEKHKIECSSMDNYVFDLAKAMKESSKSNERYIYSLKMESSNE